MLTAFQMRTQLRAAPQMVLAGKLLRVPSAELDALLQSEAAANPALQHIRRQPFACARALAGEFAADDLLEARPQQPGVFEQLASQARQAARGELCQVALRLLECLDEHGYLRAAPELLADELGIPLAQVHAGLQVLHQLEPAGLGAVNLQQRLALLLEAHEHPDPLARRLLAEAWQDFLHQRWSAAAQRLGCTRQQARQAAEWLRRNLCPQPLSLLDLPVSQPRYRRSPDLVVQRVVVNGQPILHLEVSGEEQTWMRIHPDFERFAALDLPPSERAWVRAQLERALVVLQSLQQRWSTLRRLGHYLLETQAAFFEHGAQALAPVTRSRAARALGLHESTLSRAVQDKTLRLPAGRIMPLADFFDLALPARCCLQEILQQASGSLTDQELAERLAQRGYPLARRTVAKYRQQLNVSGQHALGR
jgi:RNA polymerase sigma-54 factor